MAFWGKFLTIKKNIESNFFKFARGDFPHSVEHAQSPHLPSCSTAGNSYSPNERGEETQRRQKQEEKKRPRAKKLKISMKF